MRLPFFKDKPEDIAGIMFAHVVGFIDSLQWPGINIAEVYILAYWLQVVCVVSSGGATNRVLNVLKSYSKQVFHRSIHWLIESNRIKKTDVPAFQSYINQHAYQRRQEYDDAFQTRGKMRDVAVIAIPNLILSTGKAENMDRDVELLNSYLLGVVDVSIPRLKKML